MYYSIQSAQLSFSELPMYIVYQNCITIATKTSANHYCFTSLATLAQILIVKL